MSTLIFLGSIVNFSEFQMLHINCAFSGTGSYLYHRLLNLQEKLVYLLGFEIEGMCTSKSDGLLQKILV